MPQKAKQNKKPPVSKRTLKVVYVLVAILAIIVLVPQVVFWVWAGIRAFVPNESLYQRDMQEVGIELLQDIQSFGLAGEPVYSEFEDLGCGPYAKFTTQCLVRAYELFKGSGDLQNDVKAVDKALVSRLRRSFVERNFEQYLVDPKHDPITYRYEGGRGVRGVPTFAIRYYVANQQVEDRVIKHLIDSGRMPEISKGEYIYGVTAETDYFFCTSPGYVPVGPGCPEPPSDITRR